MLHLVESSSYSSTVAGKGSSKRRFIPVDYLILTYVSLTTLLLLIADRPVSERAWLIVGNVMIVLVVIVLKRIDPNTSSRFFRVLRRLYPVLFFTFFYEQTQTMIHLLFPGWFDAALSQFEISLFGVQPSLAIEKLYTPILNEIIIACYVFYYVCLPLGLMLLIVRRNERCSDRLITASTIAFFVSYLFFFSYPVEGPRYHLMEMFTRPLDGYVFVPLVKRIMDTAAVHGGAMPSSHSAVALLVLWYVMRASKRWGLALAPIIAGILVGCVWGRFHYVSDVVVGAAIAVLACWITEYVFRKGLLGARTLTREDSA